MTTRFTVHCTAEGAEFGLGLPRWIVADADKLDETCNEDGTWTTIMDVADDASNSLAVFLDQHPRVIEYEYEPY